MRIVASRGARLAMVALSLAACAATATSAWGQVGDVTRSREIPSRGYFLTFRPFYDGDYGDALRGFEGAGRGGVKSTLGRWIDSICYHTMVAECYYRMGEPDKALEQYTAAVKQYLAYHDWLMRVKFPALQPDRNTAATRTITWGTSQRRAPRGNFPDTILVSQGSLNVTEQVRRGGVIQQPVLLPLRVTEIVRCTALAIRRRNELLGPLSAHDPLTDELVAKLERRPHPPNHWSAAWVDVWQGLAYVGAGRTADAAKALKNGILAGGTFDHDLTGTALLELGKIAMNANDAAGAEKLFSEASLSAAAFGQYDVVEEAFRYGQRNHLISNQKGIYQPLAPAARWARTRSRQLYATLAILLAENYAVAGDTASALRLLAGDAKSGLGPRSKGTMGTGNSGAEYDYVTALVQYQAGKLAAGDAAIAAALEHARRASHRLLQIAVGDRAIDRGEIRPRAGMDVYEVVLRDPTPTDWLESPLESLSVLTTPHPQAYEHWFQVALTERKDISRAHEIADLARRHRFYSSLPMGGRLLSLRWIMEFEPGTQQLRQLNGQADTQRRDLLARFPKYQALATEAGQIRAKLAAMPLVIEDPKGRKDQERLLGQLAAIGQQQEVILRELAIRREPGELVFPPHRTTKEIQQALPKGRGVWSFYYTAGQLHAFLYGNEKYAHWRVGDPAAVAAALPELCKSMGHYDANASLTDQTLGGQDWKVPAGKILDLLLDGSKVPPAVLAETFDELVIVPDGPLWYLPFELLPVPRDQQDVPLLTTTKVRYAPTASLAIPYGGPRRLSANTGVVLGRLAPRDKGELAQAAFQRIKQVVPRCWPITGPLSVPSPLVATLFDQLVVLDDLETSGQGAYEWAPIQFDRTRATGALAQYFPLPAHAPDVVVLPAFHTPAEDAFKRTKGAAGAGHEMFLTLCGLMASGGRTVLISRWATGGQTNLDLTREFVQELPHTTAADAWQRAVVLAMDTPLQPDAEPRIKFGGAGEAPKARHPFFWSGYLLIDAAPAQADPAVAGGGEQAAKN